MVPATVLSPAKVAGYVELAESTGNQAATKEGAEVLAAEGAFGVPWIVAERGDGRRHSFFGSDRLEVSRSAGQTAAIWLTDPSLLLLALHAAAGLLPGQEVGRAMPPGSSGPGVSATRPAVVSHLALSSVTGGKSPTIRLQSHIGNMDGQGGGGKMGEYYVQCM